MRINELIEAVRGTRMVVGQSQDGLRWVLREPVLWSDGPWRELASDPVGSPNEWAHESVVDLPNCSLVAAQREA